MTKFKDLGLKDEVLKGVTDQGFEDAFPIQEAVIPVLLSGRDVVDKHIQVQVKQQHLHYLC